VDHPGLIPYVDAGQLSCRRYSQRLLLLSHERVHPGSQGKTVAIYDFGQGDHILLSSMLRMWASSRRRSNGSPREHAAR
jgi:hypothetical protein